MDLKRGFVYWVDLDPTRGSEIRKKRPCVVIGVDAINQARRTVVVIPLSSSGKEHPPLAVAVQCMGKKGIAVMDQIRAVDKSRFLQQCGQVTQEEMTELEKGIKIVLGM